MKTSMSTETPRYRRSGFTRWMILHGFKTWALRREFRLQNRFYQRALDRTPWKDKDRRHDISRDWETDDRETMEDLRKALSDKLRDQAIKLDVTLPEDDRDGPDRYSERGMITGDYMLSALGVEVLRQRIRDERKARRESVAFWATAVGGTIIGILGALTGLVAVIWT